VNPLIAGIGDDCPECRRTALEVCCEPQRKASGWADGIAGKQATKIDNVQDVRKVLPVYL
jgi:hypothetical protein